MIVRNEQFHLPDCLRSLQHIVDEIVVVDTGSTDQTIAIAKHFKSRIDRFDWQDDFSAARNRALDLCRGQWILYIDADERLESADPAKLKPYLGDCSYVAYTVRFYPIRGFSPYREYRVFKNDPRIRYSGVIHETMLSDIRKVAIADGLKIGIIPLTIRHFGYEQNQDRKHRRNLPLLRQAVKDNPVRSYLWWHLGTTLMACRHKKEALDALRKGLVAIRQKTKQESSDSLIYGELIRYCHYHKKKVMPLIDEALERFPDQYYIKWLKAVVLKSNQEYKAAADIFKELSAIRTDDLEGEIAYDEGLFRECSLEPLGDCYFKMKRFQESVDCYRKCELRDPGNSTFKIKRLFVESRLAK